MKKIEFTNLTKHRISKELFLKLYKKTMPKSFELSVVFAPPALMKKLNKTYRSKNKAANMLSFLLARKEGEIFLNVKEKDLPYLFVHGCLHLRGHDHKKEKDAQKMEALERKILGRR